MNTTASATITGHRGGLILPIGLALVGLALCMAVGVSVGYPTPLGRTFMGLLAGIVVLGVAFSRPALALQIVAASSVMLIVWVVGYGYTLNAFDVLLPPLLLTWLLARERSAVAVVSEERATILTAERKLIHAVLWYFGIAAASLLLTVFRHGVADAAESGIVLVRGFQGVMVYALGRWLIRREKDIHRVVAAMLIGGLVFALVSAAAVGSGSVRRAGMVWYANEPLWSIGSPNEAAIAMLLLWGLLLARQAMRPKLRNLVMLGVVLVMMVLTQSRSGLLSLFAFTVLCFRMTYWRPILTGVALMAISLPFVPQWYWERMARTLVLERGSFEAFSSLVRFYGWQAAWQVFLDHPIFGVGFLGFRLISADYNALGLSLLTTESIFLEAATGMGIIGLIALICAIVRLYQLGHAVSRVAPPGTMGAGMAQFHTPLITGFVAGNLTGNNWVGLVCLAQTALWCAMLVSAGERSIEGRRPA